jgi:hypothetical protein
MTALIGRATACIGSGAGDPGRVSTAIATLDILRGGISGRCCVREKNVEDGTSAGGAEGAVEARKVLSGCLPARVAGPATATATVTDTGIGHGHGIGIGFVDRIGDGEQPLCADAVPSGCHD